MKKVDAHHAIIPTPKKASVNALSANEMKIYQQIARQYLTKFYPAAVYALKLNWCLILLVASLSLRGDNLFLRGGKRYLVKPMKKTQG